MRGAFSVGWIDAPGAGLAGGAGVTEVVVVVVVVVVVSAGAVGAGSSSPAHDAVNATMAMTARPPAPAVRRRPKTDLMRVSYLLWWTELYRPKSEATLRNPQLILVIPGPATVGP